MLDFVYALLFLVGNVIIAIAAFAAYRQVPVRKRFLFYLGVSSVLGVVGAVITLVLPFVPLWTDGPAVIAAIGVVDLALWIYALRALLKDYVRWVTMAEPSPGAIGA